MVDKNENLSLPDDQQRTTVKESDDKAMISEKEAAQRYPYSVHWFRRARWEGNGPRFIKIGRRVMYVFKEIEEWFMQQPRYQSTSEYRTMQ